MNSLAERESMKVGELVKPAEDAVDRDLQERVAQMVACKIQEIRAAKRVVAKLESELEILKNQDVDDFLLETPAPRGAGSAWRATTLYGNSRPITSGRIVSCDVGSGGPVLTDVVIDDDPSSSGE